MNVGIKTKFFKSLGGERKLLKKKKQKKNIGKNGCEWNDVNLNSEKMTCRRNGETFYLK
jgi:hypothetical protein